MDLAAAGSPRPDGGPAWAGASAGGSGHAGAAGPPVLSLVRGAPTDEELAALVAVLLAGTAGGAGHPAAVPARPRWGTATRPVPAGLRPGPGAWRAYALPR